jgi:hypothetical protein
VFETAGGPGFPAEALDEVGVEGHREGQHLERDFPVEVLVERPVDDRHPAAAQLLAQLEIVRERLADDVELGDGFRVERLHRHRHPEVQPAGGTELGGRVDGRAAPGTEHGRTYVSQEAGVKLVGGMDLAQSWTSKG